MADLPARTSGQREQADPVWEPLHVLNVVSTASALIFLIILPFRLRILRASSIKNVPGRQGMAKAIIGALLSTFLLLRLAQIITSPLMREASLVISLLASLLAACGLTLLLPLEQQRSLRSSDTATLYLVASISCDFISLTMPSGTPFTQVSHALIFRASAHAVLLALECGGNRLHSNLTMNSPDEINNVLSRVFFTWINAILLQGYRRILVDYDLPPLARNMQPKRTREAMLRAWAQRLHPERKSTLPLALLACVKRPLLAAVLPRLFLITFRYSQPILIKQSIRFVLLDSTSRIDYGYWLVVSAIVIYIGLALSASIYQHRLNKLKLATRSALIGVIHDKIMTTSSISYDNGESTTLMSSDADSLDGITEMLHETWAQAIEVIIGIILLANEVGWIWPRPLVLIFLCSYVSRYVAKHLEPRQKAWNRATQSRVAVTSTMISSMKTIKMLGLQFFLAARVRRLREDELSAASKLRWVMVYYNASANALGIFSPVITLIFFAIASGTQGRALDTETAFTTMAILSMVTHPANMIMTIVPRAVASFAGFDRIQSYLIRPLLQDSRGRLPKATLNNLSWNPATGQLTNPSPTILIRHLTIGEPVILGSINIEMAPRSVTILSGPVGSGKSTLLRAILGEVPILEGSIKLSSRQIAYCAQRPWLPSGTIKEVIQGATDSFDERRYDEVTENCCLIHDFDTLHDGDETQVGSRGMNLSGGQRQRVALARALYSRHDIILLDDTFSGLDGVTEDRIFGNLFGATGLLRRRNATVVLVSNSSQYFEAADHIVVLGNQGIVDQGDWQGLQTRAKPIEKLTRLHGRDDAILQANFDRLRAQARARDEAETDLSRRTGDLKIYGYYFKFVGVKSLFLLAGSTASYSFFITFPQYWLQLWTEATGNSHLFYICGFLLLSIMSWTSTNGIMWSTVIRLAPQSGYALHQRLLHVITKSESPSAFLLGIIGSTNAKFVYAPLFFFSRNDNGSILNRFSQDIQLIDKQLPFAFANLGTQIFKLLMQAVLLASAQKWLALSLPACVVIVYIIQKVYLRTSRQLRFLELEFRAAVFSSFLESIEGLETIRAFGRSHSIVQENIFSVDKSQRPEFLLLSLQRWLNVVLDLLIAAIGTSVIAIAVALRGQISGSQVGIALNIMLVANTTLVKLVENWTTLETSLGAVARLKSLEDLTPSEGLRSESFQPPLDWPPYGRIEFIDVTASYDSKSPAVQNFSLNVAGGQRLIICGRTGSGKSTLLLTLLRVLELQSGKIELDGVDLSQVRLDLLREKCFITVAQDSFILPNETLRFNLDPDGSLSTDTIIGTLVRVGLWTHFAGGETGVELLATMDHPVLDNAIASFPELSVGQSQLLSLCRALNKVQTPGCARVKPVVLLDEVTSSLDPETEAKIYAIVNEEFTQKGHTVIIIAHRSSVLSGHSDPTKDVVAVLGNGRLLEVIREVGPATLKNIFEGR